MIRTTILSAAALLALAGAANAAPVKPATIRISVGGKTEAAVKAEISKAVEAVCTDVPAMEYTACVEETHKDAMIQFAKIKAVRTASLR